MSSILSTLVLATHLIAVDVAMAAPLACIWLVCRSARRADRLAGQLSRSLARLSIGALAVAILLGTLQLGVLWLAGDRGFFDAAARVPAGRLWFALGELLFFFACMGAYLAVGRRASRPWLASGLALLGATDLMYHFPPLFAMLNLLAARPELVEQRLSGSLFRALMLDPEVFSMVLHVWLAAVAVTAVVVMYLASAAGADSLSAPSAAGASGVSGASAAAVSAAESTPIAVVAARWGLGTTVLQLPVGLWVLLATSPDSRRAILGTDTLTTALFALALLAALALLHHLAAAAQGDVDRARAFRASAWMLAVVLLMTAVLGQTRKGQRAQAAAAAPRAAPSIAALVRLGGTSTSDMKQEKP